MAADTSLLGDQRILVTGGAGFIGSHLVDAIVAHDPPAVVVADNFFIGRPENLQAASDRYPALVVEDVDTSDRDAVLSLLRRYPVDVVFDLATLPLPYSLENPYDTVIKITQMAAVLADAARAGEFGTLVHFSSSEVYGTATSDVMSEDHPVLPKTPYAAAKAAADHTVASYIDTFDIDSLIIRPFNNYGPRQNEAAYAALIPIAIRNAAAGRATTIFGDGEQTRDFIYVADTIEGTLAAYSEPEARGTAINLATGRESTVTEVVSTVYELMGSEPRIEWAPPRPGDVRRHKGSSVRAASLLGFESTTSLRDGLAATVAWYRELVL